MSIIVPDRPVLKLERLSKVRHGTATLRISQHVFNVEFRTVKALRHCTCVENFSHTMKKIENSDSAKSQNVTDYLKKSKISSTMTSKMVYTTELYLALWKTSRIWSIYRRHLQWPGSWTAHNTHFRVTPILDAVCRERYKIYGEQKFEDRFIPIL